MPPTPHPALPRFLTATLRSLRRLPPGTRLRDPSTADERALIDELLRLPDDVDPIRWLQGQRGDAVARLALYREFLALKDHLVWADVRSGNDSGRADVAETWMGDFVPLPGSENVLVSLSAQRVPDRSSLREILQELALAWRPPRHMDRSRAEGHAGFYQELFELSRATDPIEWVRDEHGRWAAVTTLRSLLDACLPSRSAGIGPEIGHYRPATRVDVKTPFSMMIQELVFGKGGFAVTILVRIPPDYLPELCLPGHILLRWNGFEQVLDDCGNSYVTLSMRDRGIPEEHWTNCVFYPHVYRDATTLTFAAHPATLASVRMYHDGTVSFLEDIDLGDVTWQVAIRQ